MFGILKPAPHIEEIQDENVVKKQYKYWQFRTLIGMYIGYVIYYFTRKNLPFAMPGLMTDLGFSKTDLGWVLTLSSLAYGVSKFTSGIISDRSNPRYFMAFGLIITGMLNLIFGMSSSLFVFAILWGLNGWFQGWGWPPCSRLLTHWYGQKERARWWAVWNTSHNIGGLLIPIIATQIIFYFTDWRYALFVPGIIAIGTGFFLINRLRDTPQSLGLPAIERVQKGQENFILKGNFAAERELTTREILFKYVLNNRYIWLLAVASFFVYVVRQGINDWSAVFLMEQKGYESRIAGYHVALFELGGLFGSLISGWMSDVIFKGRRGPVNVLFCLCVIGAIAGFWFVPAGNWILSITAMFAIGFFVFGPQMLLGIAAAELSHKKAAATATGFAGLFAYLGAATAGAPIATVTQNWGWGAFYAAVAACGLVATLLLLPMWKAKQSKVEIPQPIAEPAEATLA